MAPLLGIVLVDVKSARTLATIIISAIAKAAMTIFLCKAIFFFLGQHVILSLDNDWELQIQSENADADYATSQTYKCRARWIGME